MEQLSQFIINHWQLWLLFIVVLFLTFLNELFTQKKKVKELSPQASVALINEGNALVIDIRDKELFKKGHIIDSINAKAEDFEQQKMDKHKSKTLIIVCARGIQASALATKIRAQGFQPLVLKGGIAAWQGDDLPLVKGR